MNRQEAKEWLPIIQAWAEGKPIQYQTGSGSWSNIIKDIYTDNHPSYYRIKPEPKYRPFKSREECWQEMLKHYPFGWIYNKNENINYCIISVQEDRIELPPIEKSYSKELENDYYLFNVALKEFEYTFADGTPFGIKEECDEK